MTVNSRKKTQHENTRNISRIVKKVERILEKPSSVLNLESRIKERLDPKQFKKFFRNAGKKLKDIKKNGMKIRNS